MMQCDETTRSIGGAERLRIYEFIRSQLELVNEKIARLTHHDESSRPLLRLDSRLDSVC